ncbi:MAG: hypothetical protein QOG67_3679, partial [Verrucomicrobiota bacterium]
MTTKTNLPVARILIHRKRSHLGLISALAFAVASCGSVMVSLAADVTSTWNAGSGDWGVAANWNPNSFFPKNGSHGFTFDAILNNGGTINLDQNIAIQKFTLTSGTLTGSKDLTTNELLTWTAGTMSGSGMTNANGGMSLNSSGVNLFLDTRTLNNAAGQTATWTNTTGSGGDIRFVNGAIFNNNGTFLAQSDQGIFSNGGGGGTFNNAGTFTRNNNSTTLTIGGQIIFNNTGTVNVQTGTLALQGGDSGNTTGAFNVSSGATLNLQSNFTFAAGSSFAGAGTVNFNSGTSDLNGSSYNVSAINVAGGTANFNTNASVVGINLTSGTLAGTGMLNASGLVTWSGGTMSGTGVTNANGGMSLVDGGPLGYLYLDTRTLDNAAGQTATWTTDPSNFGYSTFFQNGATLNNNGTFLVQS